ncbi:MAG: zf-HC2 domain-containing protein [Gemmatimonadaceae bacterium]
MDDREREHPDEGTIHAWLDGALDAAAARELAAHVAGCPVCAERVAEARGLIAGASRIVSALDDVPSATGPAWGQAPVAPVAPVATAAPRGWRLLRVTPARAAIAATLLVALGVSLTYERVAVDSQATRAVAERTVAPPVEAAPSTPAERPAPVRRDPLLDSAIARNIAKAQPPRAVEPAPGPELPMPAVAPTGVIADAAAPARVAAGRAAIRAEREAAGAAPDQLAARAASVAPSASDRAMAAAARVDTVTTRAQAAAPSPAGGSSGSVVQSRRAANPAQAAECYRVESANGVAATWGADALPLVVRVDSAGRGTVLTVAGQATGSQATVTRAGDDSLLLRLRRIGYEGTLALGAPGEARAGVMRSRPLETQLGQVVTTATAAEEPTTARRRAPAAKQAPQPAQAPAAAEARSAATAAPAVPVVARRIACSG